MCMVWVTGGLSHKGIFDWKPLAALEWKNAWMGCMSPICYSDCRMRTDWRGSRGRGPSRSHPGNRWWGLESGGAVEECYILGLFWRRYCQGLPLRWVWRSEKVRGFTSLLPFFVFFFVLFCFVFLLFRTASTAYGSSQARGRIRDIAAGLCQSPSNRGSEPHLRPTPQLTATRGGFCPGPWCAPGVAQQGRLLVPSTMVVGMVSLGPSAPTKLESPDRKAGQGWCKVTGKWVDVWRSIEPLFWVLLFSLWNKSKALWWGKNRYTAGVSFSVPPGLTLHSLSLT